MANTPSFFNLDQAQSNLKTIQGNINNEINNIDTRSIQETKAILNSIDSDIKKVQQTINSNNMLDPLKQELQNTMDLFQRLRDVSSQSINSQRQEIQSFANELASMEENLNAVTRCFEGLSKFEINDNGSIEQIKKNLENLMNSFKGFVQVSDIISCNESDFDDMKSRIMRFMSSLASDGSKIFNLSGMLMQSADDPQLQLAYKNMLKPLNDLIDEIPDNIVKSFNKSQANINGGSTSSPANVDSSVSYQQLLDNVSSTNAKMNESYNQIIGEFSSSNDKYLEALRADREKQQQIERENQQRVGELFSHLSKYTQAVDFSKDMQGKMGDNLQSAVGLETSINAIFEKLRNEEYSKTDAEKIKAVNGDIGTMDYLKNSSLQIQDVLNQYTVRSRHLDNSLGNYASASAKYSQDANTSNFEALINAEKQVQESAEDAAEAIDRLFLVSSSLNSVMDLSDIKFNEIPEDLQNVLIQLNNLFKTNTEASDKLFEVYDAFNLQFGQNSKNLMDTMEHMAKTANNLNDSFEGSYGNSKYDGVLDGAKSKFGSVMKSVTQALGIFGGAITSTLNVFNGLGLNPGIPTSGRGFISYLGGGTEWYKKFAEQEYEGAMSQISRGGNINEDLLDFNRQEGLRLQHDTHGKIQYNEYSNMSNKLMSQVQGHYGSMYSKENGMNDMNNMTGLALMMEKVYGVDSVNSIQTFYKELGMGSNEVNDLLSRLTGTAEAANIPVSQYVKTISDMSLKFKELGVDVKLAENGIRNLTLSGMSMSNATDLMGGFGNAINKFTDNPGEMGFYGMVSGQFSNPWEAMWEMSDMWDSKGNVKEDATQNVLNAMGTKLDMFSGIYGADPNLQKWGISETFKDMGFSKKQSTILTNAYMEGDYETFDKMFEKYLQEDDNSVTLVGQDELEKRLSDAADKTDELTKAEIMVMESQQNLAEKNKELLDTLGQGLQGTVATLTGSLDSLNDTLLKILGIGGEGEGGERSKVGNIAMGILSNPLTALLGIGTGATTMGLFGSKILGSSAKGFGAAKAAGSGTSAALKAGGSVGAKTLGKGIPIVSGILDGGLTFFESKGKGKTTGASVIDGIGSGAGTGLGTWGGAAAGAAAGATIGSAVPIIGTGIGGLIGGLIGGIGGGFGGNWFGKKAAEGVTNIFGIDQYEDPEKQRQYESRSRSNNPYVRMGKHEDDKLDKNLSKMSDTNVLIQNGVNDVSKGVNGLVGAGSMMQSSVFESGKNIDRMVENTNTVSGSIIATNRNIDKLTTQVSVLGSKVDKGDYKIRNNKADLLINPKTGNIISSDEDILSKNMKPKGIVNPYTQNGTSRLLRNQNDNLEKVIDISKDTKKLQDEKYGDMITSGSKRNDILTQMNSALSSLDTSAKDLKKSVGRLETKSGSGSSGKGINGLAPLNGDAEKYKNQDLRNQSLTSAEAINDFINRNAPESSKMRGMGDAFMKAAEESGLDPAYLVAHAALETGWGTSTILNDKNNWFGIGAFDSSPYESAYGFNNLEAGIVEGAKWISKNYTNDGQETLWKMINDPNGSHNYATDPEWANKIASIMVDFPRLMANAGASSGSNSSNPILDFYGTRGPNSYGSYKAPTSRMMPNATENSSLYNNNESDLNNAMGTDALSRVKKDPNSLDTILGSNTNNTIASVIYNTGSSEYTNGAQHYNPMKYKDADENFVFYDAQAIARSTYLETVDSSKAGYQSQYKDAINSYDDRKSVYNTKPNFNINISVSSGENEEKYNAMAEQLRVAIGAVVEQSMGSSARIAYSNYERNNSQYE